MNMDLLILGKKILYKGKIKTLLEKTRLSRPLGNIYSKLVSILYESYPLEVEGIKAEFYIDSPIEAGMVIGFSGEEKVFKIFLDEIRKKNVVFDIGANIGLYSILAAQKSQGTGLVVSFEPEPSNYKRLTQNVNLNKLENVKTYNIALSDFNGITKLNIIGNKVGSTDHTISPTIGDYKQINVNTRRLDDFITEYNLPKPDLIKMDIEGAELNALRGMESLLDQKDRCPIIICEIHPNELRNFGYTDEDLLNFLKERELKIKIIDRRENQYFIKVIS